MTIALVMEEAPGVDVASRVGLLAKTRLLVILVVADVDFPVCPNGPALAVKSPVSEPSLVDLRARRVCEHAKAMQLPLAIQ